CCAGLSMKCRRYSSQSRRRRRLQRRPRREAIRVQLVGGEVRWIVDVIVLERLGDNLTQRDRGIVLPQNLVRLDLLGRFLFHLGEDADEFRVGGDAVPLERQRRGMPKSAQKAIGGL